MKTIRELRQARGWTQYELALKVGVHPQAVYLWESGRRTPQVPQLRALGQRFGLCSDGIDLEPPRGVHRAPHRARADRAPGEPIPGRDRQGRPAPRGSDDDPGTP